MSFTPLKAAFCEQGESSGRLWRNRSDSRIECIPISCRMYLVKIFATLFAEVFVRGAFGAKDADAGAMLPDFANVTLNEKPGNIFGEFNSVEEFGIRTIHRWATGIVL